jgi:hypothetical protein
MEAATCLRKTGTFLPDYTAPHPRRQQTHIIYVIFETLLLGVLAFIFSNVKPINPFQPSDAMWRHTFHLSLIRLCVAHLFLNSSWHTALTFLRTAVYAKVTQHMNKGASSCVFCRRGCRCAYKTRKNWHMLGDFIIYSRA